ncbi:MAG: paraquat-inducible protein A [Halarcobacter sp.]
MNNIIECKHCGLFLEKKQRKIICPRCESKIVSVNSHTLDSLYYAITALLLFVLLNMYPLISLTLNGNNLKTTLFESFIVFFQEDFIFVALLVFFTVIVAPVLNSLIIIFAFIQSRSKKRLLPYRVLYDGFHIFKTWGFVEVFIVSIIVTYIKLIGMVASTRFDVGFYIMLLYLFMFYMSNRKFEIKSVLD